MKNEIGSGSGDIGEIGIEMNDRSSTHNPVRDESNDNEEEMRLLKEQLKKQEIELKRKSSKEQTLKFKLIGQSKRR